MSSEQEQTIIARYKIRANDREREDFVQQLIGCTIYEPQDDSEWVELPMPPYPPAEMKRRAFSVDTEDGVWTLHNMERVSPLGDWITTLQMKASLWPQAFIDQGLVPVNSRERTAIEITCKPVGASLHVTATCHISGFRSYFEGVLRDATEGWNAEKPSGISIELLRATDEERLRAYSPEATMHDIEKLPHREVVQLSRGVGSTAQNAQKILDALQLSVLNIYAAAAGVERLTSLDEFPRVDAAIADHIKTFGGKPDDPKWQSYPIIYLREQAEIVREIRALNSENLEPETAAQVLGHVLTELSPLLSMLRLPHSVSPQLVTTKDDPMPVTDFEESEESVADFDTDDWLGKKPADIPQIYRINKTGYEGAVIYLDTDAQSFWSVITRHSLGNFEPLYNDAIVYRAKGLGDKGIAPPLNEWGTYVWLHPIYEDDVLLRYLHGYGPNSRPGYGGGVRIAWEIIRGNQLRVVLTAGGLMPNLNMAWNILNTIWRIYPESRAQLLDIDGLIETWAYDEATRAEWREKILRWAEYSQKFEPMESNVSNDEGQQLPQGKKTKEAESTHRPWGWPKKGILKCNKWLSEQYFGNSRTSLKDLEDEWVRIRREQDRAEDVQNNIANMRTFINEEKKRKGYS